MNKFTPEYIELCKNEKVQGLRPILNVGDYNVDIYGIFELNIRAYNPDGVDNEIRKAKTWLPTGDQLDEEIVKICKKNKYFYDFKYDSFCEHYYCFSGEHHRTFTDNINPLIAKIKLLIQLSEGE